MGTGVTRREKVGIHQKQNHESKNQPQNTRNGPASGKQDVADIQMNTRQNNPIEPFQENQNTCAESHSILGIRFIRQVGFPLEDTMCPGTYWSVTAHIQ